MSLEPADGNPAPYRCKHNCERDELMDRIAALTAEVARKDEALREIGDHNRFGWTLQTELARAALEARND